MQIKIYTADVRELDDPELFRFVYNGVSSDRKAKTDRMVFDKDKKLSLGAGALLEYVLAARGVADLTFTTEHNKKPRLANEEGIIPIREQRSFVLFRIMISDVMLSR